MEAQVGQLMRERADMSEEFARLHEEVGPGRLLTSREVCSCFCSHLNGDTGSIYVYMFTMCYLLSCRRDRL
jgi:hypothetical protein